ncbi:hypothetical protein NDA03_26440 [Trichocoleus sp. Lan]
METSFTPKNTSSHNKYNFFQLILGWELLLKGSDQWFSTTPDALERSPEFAEIEKLVESLSREPGVEFVRAIAHKPDSLGEVTIELLSCANVLEQRQLREKAIDLVTEAEWKLSDLTQSEDWFFDAKVTRKFDDNLGQGWLVTSRHAES